MGGSKGQNLQRRGDIRCIQKKKDYSMYETFFLIYLMVTTCKKPKTEMPHLKKEETEDRGMKYHQTKKQQTETQKKIISGGTELPENKR